MTKFSYILIDPPASFGSFEKFTDALRYVKDAGFSGAELHLAQPMGFDVKALVDFSASIDLPIVSFMTGLNYFSDGLCLASPRAEIRQGAVERLSSLTEVAARFGAVMVVGQMQGFLSDEPNRAIAEARIEECLKQVAVAAERNGATIVLEPVNHLQTSFHNTLADIMALCKRIGSPRIKPMLDSFHMNIEEQSMTEPIQRVGSELEHFHLCESNGSILGSGHLDFKVILDDLAAINYTKWVSVKIYRLPWPVGTKEAMQLLTRL